MYRQLSKQLLGKEEEVLGNELSAPYEVPQFPIEQIQSKLQKVRADGSQKPLPRQHSLEPVSSPSQGSGSGGLAEASGDSELCDEADLADLVSDFQRVKISGEDNTGVPVEDLAEASHLLVRALAIRERYMSASHQEFPTNVQRLVSDLRFYINKVIVCPDILMESTIKKRGSQQFWTRPLLQVKFYKKETYTKYFHRANL